MLFRTLISAGLVSAGLLLILLTSTTPSSTGAFGILAVFLLSYVVVLTSLTFILRIAAMAVDKLGSSTRLLRKRYDFSLRKSYYYSSVLALGPVIMISLQSVGGMGLYELILITIFIVIGCLYVSRRTA